MNTPAIEAVQSADIQAPWLQALGPDIWTVRHEFSAGGLHLGTRTTVVKLPDGSLLLHSPGKLDSQLRGALSAIGPVSHIVAPNKLHHLFVDECRKAFPQARLAASPGVGEKLGVEPDLVLGSEPEPAWREVLEQVQVEGIPVLEEVAFFHRPSSTLMLADLCFNLQSSSSWFTRTMMRLNDGWQRFGPTRLMRSSIKDPRLTRRSIDRMLDWPVERISVCHGEIVNNDGRSQLERAFAYLSRE